jgi:hypothetical protein
MSRQSAVPGGASIHEHVHDSVEGGEFDAPGDGTKPRSAEGRLLRGTMRARWLRCRRSMDHQYAVATDALPSHPPGAARDAAPPRIEAKGSETEVGPDVHRRWLCCVDEGHVQR